VHPFRFKMSEQRVKLYSKFQYGFAEALGFIPFRYEYNDIGPSCVVPIQCSPHYYFVSSLSCVTVTCFVVYLFLEVWFGDMSMYEAFFVTGANCLFANMCACQWLLFIPRTRNNLISVMNAVLFESFHYSHAVTVQYEIIHFITSFCGIFYPFIYFPSLILVSIYFPLALNTLLQGIDFAAVVIDLDDPHMTKQLSWMLRLFILAFISGALGHATVTSIITCLWFLTYSIRMTQSLEKLVKMRSACVSDLYRRYRVSNMYYPLKYFQKAHAQAHG
jgi:hypothetical protein